MPRPPIGVDTFSFVRVPMALQIILKLDVIIFNGKIRRKKLSRPNSLFYLRLVYFISSMSEKKGKSNADK